MSGYEAILFDFDGVLVDSEPIHYHCWAAILRPFGIRLEWDYYCSNCIGISDREMIKTLVAAADSPVELDEIYALYPKKRDMFRERMLADPPILSETRALLHDLNGLRLAVVTSSGRPEVEPILERIGILSRFQAAVYWGDVARPKPAPDPYLKAAADLGVRRALVVEDSVAGRESGRAAGFDVLEINRPSEVAPLVRERLGLSAPAEHPTRSSALPGSGSPSAAD